MVLIPKSNDNSVVVVQSGLFLSLSGRTGTKQKQITFRKWKSQNRTRTKLFRTLNWERSLLTLADAINHCVGESWVKGPDKLRIYIVEQNGW